MPPTEDELEETQASLMQHARTTDIPIIEPLPHLPPARINWKMLSLIGLVAMLVIASFIGFSSFNSGRSANGHATAVQALQNTHATATAQANIQATSTAQAAATAAVTSNPYDPDFNKLVFYDQLTVNTDKHWDETSTRCSFAADGYHVLSSTQTIQPCIHHDANFDDMTFQMKMTIVKGSGGGLLFHTGSAGAYYFRINQDRTYALFACTSSGSSCTKTLRSGYSSWITPGLNQSNILDVVTVGQDFYLYVNVHEIDWVNDPTSPNGQFGGLAEAQSETVFSDLKVWTV
jgi:hypothetical protein